MGDFTDTAVNRSAWVWEHHARTRQFQLRRHQFSSIDRNGSRDGLLHFVQWCNGSASPL